MRTVEINLAGVQKKPNKRPKPSVLSEGINQKERLICIIAVAVAFVFFTLLAGLYVVSSLFSQRLTSELITVKEKHTKIKNELVQFTRINASLLKEKKELSLKLAINRQIEKASPSWAAILNDVTKTVPKQVKITDIGRINASDLTNPKMTIEIKGNVKPEKNINPVLTISYFVININENPALSSTLENATIKKIEKNDNNGLFEFTISADIINPQTTNEDGPKNE